MWTVYINDLPAAVLNTPPQVDQAFVNAINQSPQLFNHVLATYNDGEVTIENLLLQTLRIRFETDSWIGAPFIVTGNPTATMPVLTLSNGLTFTVCLSSAQPSFVITPIVAKSAYDLAVENGFVGTVEAWLDSLIGPQGPIGPQGGNGNGGGLTNLVEVLNTAAPNETVPVVGLKPNYFATNVGLVLSPKGTGAITAQVPDETVTGGNRRGIFAVDLQMGRDSADQVASGPHSFAAGYGSTASGQSSIAMGGGTATAYASVAMGNSSTASGQSSIAMGSGAASGTLSIAMGNSTASAAHSVAMGNANNATAYASVAMGNGSIASGNYSFAAGYSSIASGNNSVAIGDSNNASGDNSFAIGNTNTASGPHSFAIGDGNNVSGRVSVAIGDRNMTSGYASIAMGSVNSASGDYSVAAGYRNSASGNYSVAMGNSADTRNVPCATAHGWSLNLAGFQSVAEGSYQSAVYPLWNATTDATPVSLFSGTVNDVDRYPVIPARHGWAFEATVCARSPSDFVVWDIKGMVVCDASGVATLVGSPTITKRGETSAVGWSVAVGIKVVPGGRAVDFIVTGSASAKIAWNATMRTIETFCQ